MKIRVYSIISLCQSLALLEIFAVLNHAKRMMKQLMAVGARLPWLYVAAQPEQNRLPAYVVALYDKYSIERQISGWKHGIARRARR